MFSIEYNFLKILESIRTDFLNLFFQIITLLGEETVLVVLLSAIYFAYDKNLARKIFFITVSSLGINCVIKNFVKMPRPFSEGNITCIKPDTATGYSFPSGHTQTFATWSTAFSFHFKRKILLIISIILTLAVGFSRLYLGAHFPSDVIAGIILGFLLSYLFNILYENIKNKHKLYFITTLIFVPFAVFFTISANPLFEDFFKTFGLFAGFSLAVIFEEKYVQFDYNIPTYKKILRIIIGVLIALIIKEMVKIIFPFTNIRLIFIRDMFRYFMLCFAVLGICPLVFKKFKM